MIQYGRTRAELDMMIATGDRRLRQRYCDVVDALAYMFGATAEYYTRLRLIASAARYDIGGCE